MTWLPTYSFVHIALDFEHTGTPKKIFQIGACSRDGDCFKRDVNPECIISYETRMSTNTSLTDEYLATCPTWDIVAKEFIDWLVSKVKKNKLIFIGHGFANSELNCLKDGYKNYPSIVYPEFICTAQYIDTLDIAKKINNSERFQKICSYNRGLFILIFLVLHQIVLMMLLTTQRRA